MRNRANWDRGRRACGSRPCDLAYSIMETPFRRDVVKELCDAAHKRGIRIDLYFSHPDWYDADFRPYADHPSQVPSSRIDPGWKQTREKIGELLWMAPDPTPEEVTRMMARHRAQIEELLTNYGEIDMLSWISGWGRRSGPSSGKRCFSIRELQPNVMVRARGIGNYGDYYTPEGICPARRPTRRCPGW